MNLTWSLSELYESFDDTAFVTDLQKMKEDIEKINTYAETNFHSPQDACAKIETFISMLNNFAKYETLYEFSSLQLSTCAKNENAIKYLGILENLYTQLTNASFLFQQFVSGIADLNGLFDCSAVTKAHAFYLQEMKNQSHYLLSNEEEVMIAKLRVTGSNSFTKLSEQLTSTLLVDLTVNGEQKSVPLSLARNYAYEADATLRKSAYEAELKAYPKIEDAMAYCLNSIKGETITLSDARGYASPLEMTLIQARMDSQTLQAMLSAMKQSLPIFRKFFAKKATLLGHKNGLPFYDLFAPLGSIDMSFTYPEAASFVIQNFSAFHERLGAFAKRAFEQNWIDVEPREGKRGGAFCSNLHAIGESRILTNFTGSFSDVLTLAHELGHAYHGDCLVKQTALNSHYTMPIAETASTLCETIVVEAALKRASSNEALVILENDITGIAQVIVDIYSRFLFEDEVFRRRKETTLSVAELKEIMLWAQKEAYGDGLDHQYLHPYMWACKPHYYYADTNYYNFPYAYGMLLSKGLYGLYLEKGADFMDMYDHLLSQTGKNNLFDVAQIAGLDTSNPDFWRQSLDVVEKEIEHFLSL